MENQQEREFTAEEMAAQKEQMLQFYTESLPYLEAQLKYEDLLMKIDETRFKRTNIQMQYAMMAQAQQEAEQELEQEESTTDQPKRKLKKE
jgi:hypothetical protein